MLRRVQRKKGSRMQSSHVHQELGTVRRAVGTIQELDIPWDMEVGCCIESRSGRVTRGHLGLE